MCFKNKQKPNKKPLPGEGVDNNVRVIRDARGTPTNNRFVSGSWKGIDNK